MSEELKHALALVDFGPCRTSPSPEKWIGLASPMCQHCRDGEDVSVAAGRILAAEVRRLEAELNALRGELENAKSALGEHTESPVNIAQRISEIRDEGRAHFHTATNLLRERDKLRATNTGLLEALRDLIDDKASLPGKPRWDAYAKARAAITGASTEQTESHE